MPISNQTEIAPSVDESYKVPIVDLNDKYYTVEKDMNRPLMQTQRSTMFDYVNSQMECKAQINTIDRGAVDMDALKLAVIQSIVGIIAPFVLVMIFLALLHQRDTTFL
jgi:hypothetical protein